MRAGTISEYVNVVRHALDRLRPADREEALAELESLLRADAARSSESEAIDALGDPESYAAQTLAEMHPAGDEDEDSAPQGHILGMPFDFRGASVERVSNRVWNPADPRIFTPRLFGVGWTINLGALAVRFGLLRPDDLAEDSFERLPEWVSNAVLAVPVVLAMLTTSLMALSWPALPAEVPVHWGPGGMPDDWAPKAFAFAILFFLTVAPVAVSSVRLIARNAGARDRVLLGAALAFVATLGLGISAVTVADADGGSTGRLIWAAILAGAALSFLLLYVSSRISLKAEWRDAARHEVEEQK